MYRGLEEGYLLMLGVTGTQFHQKLDYDALTAAGMSKMMLLAGSLQHLQSR